MNSAISKEPGRAGAVAAAPSFGPKKILVPMDFIELSRAAVERAVRIAEQFGSSLVLLHAVEPVIQPVEFAIVPAEMEEVNLAQMENAKKQLAAVVEILGQRVGCVPEVRLGKPWHVIVEAAAQDAVDLIIISTHGRTGIKHVLMGSTAERVVQHAPCSVLVLR
jgi:universal stress protein A